MLPPYKIYSCPLALAANLPASARSDGARLASLRLSEASAAAAGAARKPKFVPRAAPKRSQPGDEPNPSKPAFQPRPAGGRGDREVRGDRGGRGDRDESRHQGTGRGGRSDRGGRGGRGARAPLPTGKVAFVGTMAAGSSVSSGSMNNAKPKKPTASSDIGISVLEDTLDGTHINVEEPMQWPPEIHSVMQPMALPFGRPPKADHANEAAGDVFLDENGAFAVPNDTLFFVQLPTTLPYAQPANGADAEETVPAKEGSGLDLFDKSLSAMPGGYLGKARSTSYINIHKSGKAVLVLGDKTFDIAPGQPPTFYEEVVSIDVKDQLLSMLGPVANHLVVTPDFDALLQ
ncbi:Aste57867_16512 [Aphanomyces stellatus]|uniref:Aste57867_16512 protein n=1 Tax=Aphanomyces stellatus TaxID=120398 RepID=A0A485L6V2_9STRA|nr:hypothetical protein As57867_016455 [Aphanomyces stellatus]VFT93286.1 Aste57867_16512 [Aphanomyces stellatus]